MQSDQSLSITYRLASSLRTNQSNSRTHSRKQISQIASSIRQFGFTNPLLIDEAGVLIAGHGRLKAAQTLCIETIPTIQIKGLSEAEKRALLIADNKLALNAGWDTDALKVEFEQLQEFDIDLEVTGFSVGEIDILLESSKVDPDDELIPAAPSEPYVREGDIYQLGDHRIGCGDSRDVNFLKILAEGRQVQAAFLDPPYNVSIRGHANRMSNHREFAMASGELSESDFRQFLSASLGACASVTLDGGVHFVCMDWRHVAALEEVGKSVYSALLNICVWNKSTAGMGSLYRSKHELILVYKVGTAPYFNAVELGKHGRNRTNVWDYASANSLRGSRRADLKLHPTVKPVAMIVDALCDVTRQGDFVLDAFIGSGSSLIAAERAKRRLIGCDIDPQYVQVALERWNDLTGLKPVRISTRESKNV